MQKNRVFTAGVLAAAIGLAITGAAQAQVAPQLAEADALSGAPRCVLVGDTAVVRGAVTDAMQPVAGVTVHLVYGHQKAQAVTAGRRTAQGCRYWPCRGGGAGDERMAYRYKQSGLQITVALDHNAITIAVAQNANVPVRIGERVEVIGNGYSSPALVEPLQ